MKTVTPLVPETLFELGFLHDCSINAIGVEDGRLHLHLEDLHANTVGLPEYPGGQPARVSIDTNGLDASQAAALLALALPAWIFELELTGAGLTKNQGPWKVNLRLAPSGTFVFQALGGDITPV